MRRINVIINDEGHIIQQESLPAPTCLALKGGGMKAFVYDALAKVLSEFGILQDIKFVAGSSAGAIAALLMALGYTPEEASKELKDLSLEQFLELEAKSNSTFLDSIKNLFPEFITKAPQVFFPILTNSNQGVSSGDALLKWLQKIVIYKLGNPDATFADLTSYVEEQAKKVRVGPVISTPKKLIVTVADISYDQPKCIYLSDKTAPNMSIAKAVRASASLPVFLSPVEHEGGRLIDGGTMDNLPFIIFNDEEFLEKKSYADGGVNPGVWAVNIGSKEALHGQSKTENKTTTFSVMTAAVKAMMAAATNEQALKKYPVISLPTGEISTFSFKINAEGKAELTSGAEKATREFLESNFQRISKTRNYDKSEKTSENIKDWLDQVYEEYSLSEIGEMKLAYKKLADIAIKKKFIIRAEDEYFDPNNPTANEIKCYWEFIEKYLKFKENKKINPNLQPNFKFPNSHINFKIGEEPVWCSLVKANMETRLGKIELEINKINRAIQQDELSVSEIKNKQEKLHTADFEAIKKWVGSLEHFKLLQDEKKYLQLKLKPKDETIKPNKEEQVFFKKILEAKNAPILKKIFKKIDLSQGKLFFKSNNDSDNIVFSLNFKEPKDRLLYLIAIRLFIEKKAGEREKNVLSEIYFSQINSEKNSTKNVFSITKIEEIAEILQQEGAELLASYYIIEELLNHFKKCISPNSKDTINFDSLFYRSTSFSFLPWSKPPIPAPPSPSELHLKTIYNNGITR